MQRGLWVLLVLLFGSMGCDVMNGDQDRTSALPGGPGGAESVTSAETGMYTYKNASCPIEVLKKGPAAVHLDSSATFTIEVTFGKDMNDDQVKLCAEMLKAMNGDKVGIPVTDKLPDSLAFVSATSDDPTGDLCSINGVPSILSGECGVTGQDLWWNAHFKEVKTTATLKVVTKVVKECIPPAVVGLAPYLAGLEDWNLVAWGNSNLYDSDVEGYALFGGNLEAKSYSFGLMFAGAADALSTWAVAAYGEMDLENVGVWGGKAGTMSSVIQEVGVTVYDDPDNEYHVRAMLPADYYPLFNHYGHTLVATGFGNNLVNCMGQTPCPSAGASCVLANDNHTILCTGNGAPIFFNLPQALFIPDVTEVVFVVDRQASDLAPTMVISVEGDWSATFDDPLDMRVSMRVVDADGIVIEGAASKMLWNIRGVPYLDMHSTNFLGSLLGPSVNLSAHNSLISGQVFVTSITGDVQIDWVPFDGTFFPPPQPEKCKNTAVVKSEGSTIESSWEFEVLAALTSCEICPPNAACTTVGPGGSQAGGICVQDGSECSCVWVDPCEDVTCGVGYTCDGTGTCVDINECVAGTDNCLATGYLMCDNTDGGFNCSCLERCNGPDPDYPLCTNCGGVCCNLNTHQCYNSNCTEAG